LAEVYKETYRLGKKVSKRERFGLYARIEAAALECWTLSIEAALTEKSTKDAVLKKLRIAINVTKQLIRVAQELQIINDKNYFILQEKLVEASKMAHGWLAYMERNEPRS